MLELRVPKMDKNTIESPYTLLMVKALHETGGNRVQASKPPEISYPSLLSKIKKDGIELGQGPLAERELPGERLSAYRVFLAGRHLLQKNEIPRYRSNGSKKCWSDAKAGRSEQVGA